jgi:hypothetical protein
VEEGASARSVQEEMLVVGDCIFGSTRKSLTQQTKDY